MYPNFGLIMFCVFIVLLEDISVKKEIDKKFIPHEFNLKEKQDIVIPGLGFIKVTGPIKISLYCQEGVKPYSRDNLI